MGKPTTARGSPLTNLDDFDFAFFPGRPAFSIGLLQGGPSRLKAEPNIYCRSEYLYGIISPLSSAPRLPRGFFVLCRRSVGLRKASCRFTPSPQGLLPLPIQILLLGDNYVLSQSSRPLCGRASEGPRILVLFDLFRRPRCRSPRHNSFKINTYRIAHNC